MSKAASSDGRRSCEIEAAVFEACWRLYRRQETDLLDGGVASATIARELGTTKSVVRSALQRLQDQGVVITLDGAAPDNYRARTSFVPTALYDGGDAA
jgi:hypothetical protein